MRVRRGFVRFLLAVAGSALLVMPVGVEDGEQVRVVPAIEGLRELASGTVGVGILGALVEGGDAARRAGVRTLLVATAFGAFALLRPAPPGTPRERQRTCPECGFSTARRMRDCPRCGVSLT